MKMPLAANPCRNGINGESDRTNACAIPVPREYGARYADRVKPAAGQVGYSSAPPPEPHGLVADVDAALEQQIFDPSRRQWVADIWHHREADDFRRTVEITEGISHPAKLWMPHLPINPFLSDNALPINDRTSSIISIGRDCALS